MKKVVPLIISVLIISVFLFFKVGSPAEAVSSVCPAGDVKAEWVVGTLLPGAYVYEYTNGSVTVSGDNRCVSWQANPGYNINGICIKYDGLTISPPTTNSGTWCTTSYDISHIVFASAPTLVEITNLSVSKNSLGRAVINWETGSELDVVGFNVYRSIYPNGPYYKRNTTLIPPQYPGSVMGATYSWTDPIFLKPGTYYYKLQQLDVQGQSSFHGPVVLNNYLKLILPPPSYCDLKLGCAVIPIEPIQLY